MTEQDAIAPQGVDLSRPSVARIYDWILGGTANWAIDREFGQSLVGQFPLIRDIATANRLFLHRAVRHLAKQGVRQFIDIGSGVPTMGNTHAVANEVAPDSRVVYVDNEPVAVAHSRMLLEETGDPERHAVIHGDLRQPDRLWQQAIESGVLDMEEPIALLLIAILHIQQPGPNGTDMSAKSVARFRELLPAGSYLAISHLTDDGVPEDSYEKLMALRAMYDKTPTPVILRSHSEVEAFFGDFELIEPGGTWTYLWHPEDGSPDAPQITFGEPGESVGWVGVGRKA